MAVSFDWVNKIIDILSPTTTIDVKWDIYSRRKDWVQTSDNAKYLQAIAVVWGDPLPWGKFTPSFFFLENWWKVRAYVSTDTIFLWVNLYSRDGSNPFISWWTRASIVSETTSWVTTSTSWWSWASAADVWSYPTRRLSSAWITEIQDTLAKEDTVQKVKNNTDLIPWL